MGTDPYRRLLLDTVAVTITKPPNGDSLIDLLRIATPDLDPNSVLQSPATREKLFKTLKLRIHPDKHPNGAGGGDADGDRNVTELYQNVQVFYDACVANINCRPSMNGGSGRSNSSRGYPTSQQQQQQQRAPPYPAPSPYPPQYPPSTRQATTADPYTTYEYNSSSDSHYVSYTTDNYADGLVRPRYRPTVSWSCFCHHLTNLIALTMVCAFMGFAAYICYYVLSNGG